jgi:hypothetical protein
LNFGRYYTELYFANAGYSEESVACPVKSGVAVTFRKLGVCGD